METSKKKLNPTKTNLLVDILIFVAFLLALDPHTTGESIHEWLSLAVAAAIIVHLLLHWQWIVGVTKRFFKHFGKQQSLNYVLNVLFFIDFTVMIFSGLMISETVLPTFGIHLAEGGSMRRLHTLSADLVVFIVGLHIALHWKWLFNTFKRYLVKPVFKLLKRPAANPVPSHSAGGYK